MLLNVRPVLQVKGLVRIAHNKGLLTTAQHRVCQQTKTIKFQQHGRAAQPGNTDLRGRAERVSLPGSRLCGQQISRAQQKAQTQRSKVVVHNDFSGCLSVQRRISSRFIHIIRPNIDGLSWISG